jgi:hypothetical protein
MKKKVLAILGASLLATAGTAAAEVVDVNIYGASAQYKFWTAAAPEFLKNSGCAIDDIYIATGDLEDRDNGIAMCAGSDVTGGKIGDGMNNDGKTYIIRYSTNASYDGIRAVQGLNPDGVDSQCEDHERLMADEEDTVYGSYPNVGTINSLSCKDVTIGASDVAAETFGQESHGQLKGHLGGGWEDRSIYNITMDPSFRVDRPVVVPFRFFANNDESTPVPFDNISRLMATAIFNGQVTNWKDFDPTVADIPIVVCMRHAGSGTHATLDAAVMRGDYSLMTTEHNDADFGVTMGWYPETYFNKGSSDEMRCVGQQAGAIGYADADKVKANVQNGEYGDIKLMKYMGEEAVKTDIVNGKYDFWSAQWLFSDPDDPQAVKDLVAALATYASDPANLPSSKADYWAAQNEMKVEKTTDFTFPKFK